MHVHVPIKVRVRGEPDDAALHRLASTVAERVRARMAEADRLLASVARPTPPEASTELRPAEVPTEPYDATRDLPDGYAVPSYGERGAPVAVQLRRPGRNWRVLRAITTRMLVGDFLDYAELVEGGQRALDAPGSVIPARVVWADLELEQRNVTVWLVETEQNCSLADLGTAVTARSEELLHVPAHDTILYAVTPDDGARRYLSSLDSTGQVQRLPAMAARNARRASAARGHIALLHGAWVLWAGMPLPTVVPSSLLDLGSVQRLTIPIRDIAFAVNHDAFAERHGVTWQRYVDEAGSRDAALHLLPVRAKVDLLQDAVFFLAVRAYGESGSALQPSVDLNLGDTLVDPDDAGTPAPVARAARDFAASLAPLPLLKAPHLSAPGMRTHAGDVRALVMAYFPVDAETLGPAQLRPVGHRLADAVRQLLARDVSERMWKYDMYDWLGRHFGRPTGEPRPPGGTVFEYLLADLETSGDLNRLFDAVDGSEWFSLRFRLAVLSVSTAYAGHRRVVALLRSLQAATLAGRRNTYYETVDASDTGGVDLEKDEQQRVTPGAPGHSVLGDVDSVYVTERTVKTMKRAAADRLRAAAEQARTQLVREIANGTVSRTMSLEEFVRESLARAAVAAQIAENDYQNVTIQRSLRLVEVHRRDLDLLPSWDVTLQFVERQGGEHDWLPVGERFIETADDLEARLIYWALGRAGEFYQAIGLGITLVGGALIAWEVGLVAIMVEAAGGTATVLFSIGLSELIYLIRIIFFGAEPSIEGFVMAAVEGYVMALGFRAGALTARPIAQAIGTQSVRRLWAGIVAEKLTVGVVGGGLTGGLTLLSHDFVDVLIRDGDFHGLSAYIAHIGIGAAVGVLAEFTISPVVHRLGASGVGALESTADLVAQLRRDGFSLADFVASSTEALSNFSTTMRPILTEQAVSDVAAAFRARLAEAFSAWGEGVVATRVLVLAGAPMSRQAAEGLRMFLTASEEPGKQEAARQLATIFAEHPQETVHLLEALSTIDPGVARRLMGGTFGSTADLAAFTGRLGRWSAADQRAAVRLLGEIIDQYGAMARPPSGLTAQEARDAQLAVAFRLRARAAQIQAAELRAEAQRLLDEAAITDTYNRVRATTKLDQAVAREQQAAEQEALSASLEGGVDTRPPDQRLPAQVADAIPTDAEVDELINQLASGAGTQRNPLIRLHAGLAMGSESADSLARTMFTSRSGNPIVFRVEGGTGPGSSRVYTQILPGGRIAVDTAGNALNVNVGSLERAVEFLVEKRAGASLKVYEVEAGWLRALRGVATPERGTPIESDLSIKTVQDVPRTVDVRMAQDQLQIPASLVGEFNEFVVQGSGRQLEFVPGPARAWR